MKMGTSKQEAEKVLKGHLPKTDDLTLIGLVEYYAECQKLVFKELLRRLPKDATRILH